MDDDWGSVRRELLQLQLAEQAGVVTWAQLRAGGYSEEAVRRAVRRRELARVLPRVYVTHTGPLTPGQRAWAAVLWAAPAALIPGFQDGLVHVAVAAGRRLAAPRGVVVHCLTHVDAMVHARSKPPRLLLEHAALVRIGQAATETDVVQILSSSVGRAGVTPQHVRQALLVHPTLHRRSFVGRLLGDVEGGIESVLEHGYLVRVEKAHGLPTPVRQSPRPGERRDIDYPMWGLVIELDGRLGHESWAAGNRDAARDLSDVAEGRTVLRLRWRQVIDQPCQTAQDVAAALTRRGWAGSARRCSARCAGSFGA